MPTIICHQYSVDSQMHQTCQRKLCNYNLPDNFMTEICQYELLPWHVLVGPATSEWIMSSLYMRRQVCYQWQMVHLRSSYTGIVCCEISGQRSFRLCKYIFFLFSVSVFILLSDSYKICMNINRSWALHEFFIEIYLFLGICQLAGKIG